MLSVKHPGQSARYTSSAIISSNIADRRRLAILFSLLLFHLGDIYVQYCI
jgi:hypothetical protein